MDREFSAPLHSTQFGNHLQYKQKAPLHMNPEVAELVEKGYNVRTAYRIVNNRKKTIPHKKHRIRLRGRDA